MLYHKLILHVLCQDRTQGVALTAIKSPVCSRSRPMASIARWRGGTPPEDDAVDDLVGHTIFRGGKGTFD